VHQNWRNQLYSLAVNFHVTQTVKEGDLKALSLRERVG